MPILGGLRGSTIVKPGFIWLLPDTSRPIWSIIIKKPDGTEYDLSELIESCRIQRFETRGLSSWSVQIPNDDRRWNDLFAEGDEFILYGTYESSLTIPDDEVFRGKVDNVWLGRSGAYPFCKLEGRDYPEIFDDKARIFRFDASNILDCFVDIDDPAGDVDTFGHGENALLHDYGLTLQVYDTTTSTWKIPVELSSGDWTTLKSQFDHTVTQQWQNKNVVKIAKDLMIYDNADLGWYIHHDPTADKWYFRLFNRGAINNGFHMISYQNLIGGPGRVGRDHQQELNKVVVYGMSDETTTLVMKTEEDTDAQDASWIKSKALTNKDLDTIPMVQAYANDQLANLKEAPLMAQGLTAIGLIKLWPGEKMPISLPNEDVSDRVIITHFTHIIGTNGWDTSVQIQEFEPDLAYQFKERIDEEEALKFFANLNDMKDSLFFDFQDDESSYYVLNNLKIENEILQLDDGQTTGIFTTKSASTFTYAQMDYDITKVELRMSLADYNDLDNMTFEVSNNDGTDWETMTEPLTVHTFSSVGSRFRLRITFNQYSSKSPQIAVLTALLKP